MNGTLVETRYGKLQGTVSNGIRIWRGIPYARPPVGQWRFRPPEVPDSWEGVRQAVAFGPISHQPVGSGPFGMFDMARVQSEDCLYLNIWAPADSDDRLRPVLVWIHGGAFVTGHGSFPLYDGTQFVLRGNVVVVTLNYRLGPFGFLHLSHLDESLGSNLGLLDQVAALKWIRDNIAAFGGDPERITVFGESAGSMCIAALLAMPSAKGLFKQAIMESGASQAIPAAQAEKITRRFLLELGVGMNEPDRLRTIPAEQIVRAGEALIAQNLAILPFQPVIDGDTLPKEPIRAIEEGAAEGIPLLIGTNRDEGAFFIHSDTLPMTEEAIIRALREILGEVEARSLERDLPTTAEEQARIITDLVFWRPAVHFAACQSQYAPVWMYRFDWTLPSHPLLGKAIHTLEIPFVFHNVCMFQFLGISVDEETRRLAQRIQDAWISFADKGTPSTEALPWPRYDTRRRATMVLDRICRVISDPEAEKRKMLLGTMV